MLTDLLDMELSPLELTMKRIHTDYVTGKVSREEMLDFFHRTLTNEIDLFVCKRIIDDEPLWEYIDDDIIDNVRIMMMKQIRYFPPFMHSHSFFEVIHVYRGNCINVFPESLFEMKEGDFFFIPPGMEHGQCTYDDDSVVVNFMLKKSTFDNALADLINSHDVFSDFFSNSLYAANKTTALYVNCGKAFNDYVLSTFREIDIQDVEMTNRILSLRFQLLVSYVLRDFKDNIRLYESSKNKSPLQPLLRYLQKEYQTATRHSVARRFGYNDDYLSRLIKRYTNKSFIDLLTQIRMKKASERLINTNMTIEKIAEVCGYMGKSSFYSAFKKEYGITPQKYRREHRQPRQSRGRISWPDTETAPLSGS